eukprot:gene12675-biopygen481
MIILYYSDPSPPTPWRERRRQSFRHSGKALAAEQCTVAAKRGGMAAKLAASRPPAAKRGGMAAWRQRCLAGGKGNLGLDHVLSQGRAPRLPLGQLSVTEHHHASPPATLRPAASALEAVSTAPGTCPGVCTPERFRAPRDEVQGQPFHAAHQIESIGAGWTNFRDQGD